MSLFLPIHYRIGVGFEETLRCGQLSRKQVAILWLMRAEGGPEGSMRRKDIERLLASWFETSSSTITRSLAALAQPPLKLVRVLIEAPWEAHIAFVDLEPGVNWGHACCYLAIRRDADEVIKAAARMPPFLKAETSTFRLLWRGPLAPEWAVATNPD